MLDKELIDAMDKSDAIGEVGLKHAQDTLPLMNAIREEEQHALGLVNGIVDKVLDTAKLLIGISFPALITLYSLKNNVFQARTFIVLTFCLLIVGIIMFYLGMRYKLRHLVPDLESSNARLKIYTAWTRVTNLAAEGKKARLEAERLLKKKKK